MRTRRTFHTEDTCAIEYNYATIGRMIDAELPISFDIYDFLHSDGDIAPLTTNSALT